MQTTENTQIQAKPEKVVDELDFMLHMTQVQCAIQKEINSDFILCKLEEQDKKGIIEMTSNAYFAKQMILQLAKNWNKHAQQKGGKTIDQEEIQKIKEIAQATFNMYMTRIYMTVILNRNKKENPLINLLLKKPEEATHAQEQEETHNALEKIREAVTKNNEKRQ